MFWENFTPYDTPHHLLVILFYQAKDILNKKGVTKFCSMENFGSNKSSSLPINFFISKYVVFWDRLNWPAVYASRK